MYGHYNTSVYYKAGIIYPISCITVLKRVNTYFHEEKGVTFKGEIEICYSLY